MKIIGTIIFLIFFPFSHILSQDMTVSVANTLQYGTGKERKLQERQTKEYLENLTDVRLFVGDLTLGFRLEYSNPPEFGLPFQGISKKYVEFERSGLNIRAGDLYALFSRGLAMNLFENRPIGFDTCLEGVRVNYQTDYLNVKILGGEIDYIEPLTLEDIEPRRETYSIRAAYAEIKPWKRISFGSSFVWTDAEMPTPFPNVYEEVNTQIIDSFVRFRHSLGDLFIGYAFRTGEVNDTDDINGGGMYASVSHTGSGYGVTLEYKDYRFDIVDPFERSFTFRPTRMLPFQNPPIVHKQHSYTLMSRFPRVVDFNDAVGFQLDVVGTITPTINVNANFAMASRHYKYTLNEDLFEVEKIRSGSTWFPSLSDERSPYHEVYFDVDYFFENFSSYVKLGYNSRNEFFYELLAPEISEKRRLNTLLIETQYAFDFIWSARLTTEFQRVYDSINFENNRYTNYLIGAQVSRSPIASLGLRYEFTTNRGEPGGIRDWFVVDTRVRIGSNSNFGVSYGSERGGVTCVNGICRTIKAYEGIRLFLTTVI
jgi:hypothetical protein